MQAHDLLVEKTLNNGHGLARLPDGRVLFIPGCIAGEQVQVDQVHFSKGVAWASRWQRQTESPLRNQNRCRHADICGGCPLGIVGASEETQLKISWIQETLSRGLDSPPPRLKFEEYPFLDSRRRGQWHVQGKAIGFFHRYHKNTVVSCDPCPVLGQTLDSVRDLLSRVFQEYPWQGIVAFLLAVNEGKAQVALTFIGPPLSQVLQDVLASCPLINHVVHKEHQKGKGQKLKGNEVTLNWMGHHVAHDAESFFQANPESWPWFWRKVQQFEDTLTTRQPFIWDAHGGAGFLSLALKRSLCVLTEPARDRILALKQAASLSPALRDWRFFAMTAETLIRQQGGLVKTLNGIILDPPRTGLSREMLRWLVDQGPSRLLYFSCDFPTFHRDLKHLQRAYQFASTLFVSNVPGTLRVETALELQRHGG